ncbi:cytochrome P450 4C1-like [Daphnia carinata]|uniref:cytochrome P450 4C1-like n=1 Tax=Daphnia carinata TaxID=120202 RepID=UPI00257B9FDE|nr:cytochrome P450 4C1-like [Daphnia carinata]
MFLFNLLLVFSFIGLLLLLTCIGWWVYVRISPFHIAVNRIPGPKSLPFIGNTLDIAGGLQDILYILQEKWPQQFGGIYRFFVGTHCYVTVSSPEMMEIILSSQKTIDKGSSYDQLVPWLGQGLLINSGDLWRSRRKMLTPAFHFSILNSFIEVFNEQSRILCGILDDVCASFAEGKAEIDVYPFLTKCSLDIICETTMGTRINAQTEDSDYVNAVYRIGRLLVERFQNPFMRNPTIFSFTALGKEHERLLKTLHGFTESVIHNRREVLSQKINDEIDHTETGIKNRLPLLDLLLKASNNGEVLSSQDIRNEIDTFMVEGHDTTASLLGWFLYSMAANPDCQKKVWNELQSTFGDSERYFKQQDISNLKYLECCIKETLRIYPSVPGVERTVVEDIQLGEYLVPAGCTLGLLVYAAHRNPKFFPDPLVFNPERFFPDEAIGRHPYAYVPFSAGPRNCIGQRFALLESKTVLSTLLRRFKFEIAPNAKQPILSDNLILKSMNGINLLVSRR